MAVSASAGRTGPSVRVRSLPFGRGTYAPGIGRFTSPQDPLFQRLNSSVSFDFRLAPYDLELSRAHARMLASRSIISGDDLAEIERGLTTIRKEIDSDAFEIRQDDEDIHMAIERRLIELIGPAGGK